MQGYRTIIFNVVALIVLLLNKVCGIEIVPEDINTITEFIYVIGNIYLRWKTTTPIGKQETNNA